MKILYFSRGLTVHDQRFLTALANSENQVFFLRIEPPVLPEPSQVLPGGVVEPAPPGTDLKQVIAEVQPDLVHAGPLDNAGMLAAKSGFHPLVLMSWGSDILFHAGENPLIREKIAAALTAADVLIADCQAVRVEASNYGFPDERIVVFPWGVNLSRFSPRDGESDLRVRLGWQDAFVMLHLRAWESLYGIETVAIAFADAAHKDDRLRLLLPGYGSQASLIAGLFEKAGVADRVFRPGPIRQVELPEYFRAADLYLSASHSDGSSVSLMEALACGLPALVSDIPGNREWVTSHEQGWLFPVDDVTALVDNILRIIDQPALLPIIAGKARLKAEAMADWAVNQQGIFIAYELARSIYA